MQNSLEIRYEEYLLKFRNMIKSLGLNNSIQKEYVLKLLFESESHLSADEIQQIIKKEEKVNIGIATVYRILNLFEEMGIVSAITIQGMDSKMYELSLKAHHDHLICINCNKIIEFVDKEIEELQEQVAKNRGFVLQSHNMIMYGICKECQNE